MVQDSTNEATAELKKSAGKCADEIKDETKKLRNNSLSILWGSILVCWLAFTETFKKLIDFFNTPQTGTGLMATAEPAHSLWDWVCFSGNAVLVGLTVIYFIAAIYIFFKN